LSFRALRRAIVSANHSFVAMEPRASDMLAAIGVQLARGERVTDEALLAACGDDDGQARAQAQRLAAPMFVPGPKGTKTAVVSFRGIVTYDVEWQPAAVSTKLFAQTMRELAADDSVKSIVLVVDTPGGTVFGLPECADAVWQARQSKPVTAVVDILCASAGYYVASQATTITAMPSGAGVGSIGVRMMHVSCAGAMAESGVEITNIYSGDYKVEGNMFEPLSDEAKARYQFECDTLYNGFLATVARGRGVSVADVKEKFGKGRVLMPAEAKRVGMIDRLETPAAALSRLGVVSTASASAEEAPHIATSDAEPVEAAAVVPAIGAEPAATEAVVADQSATQPVLPEEQPAASIKKELTTTVEATSDAAERVAHLRRLLDLES